MTNKIEKLRAILFTKDDLSNISNIGDLGDFSSDDIDYMVEFKKIYELGTNQLEKFLGMLEGAGGTLDSYSIMYYVAILKNGPFKQQVQQLTSEKKFFKNSPDIMGLLGNVNAGPQNNSLFEDSGYSMGCSLEVYNKLPDFFRQTMKNSIQQTEDVFRSCLKSSTEIDNTLPIIDKKNQDRYNSEDSGDWATQPNGSYLVKDNKRMLITSEISSQIYDSVKGFIGDDDYKLYTDKKEYSPFNQTNESTSKNYQVQKNMVEGDKSEMITLDLMGDVFDSDGIRGKSIKISNVGDDKNYTLNSNTGQLGL